ncbi:lmo0937 family membrane protein [Phenylobacterium sp.]|uniref:lmo0937 family membrane protein n=1 Tax=Phenylobacterium sp. TaxID=1871053 RepID=UPI0025DF6171|nr:lmo0937 family membrane protein [Phenylobacterium sp.]
MAADYLGRPEATASPLKDPQMLGILALVLVVLWLLGFFAFHITTAAIHLILVVALILVVLHFLRGRRSV